MMEHHKGAVTMVEELHRQPGTAYDPVVFNFTNDVVSDQNAEISRMNAVLAGLSNDPRATLAAGFRDAGQAISHLGLRSEGRRMRKGGVSTGSIRGSPGH